ncbi:unnamed protein product, partial [Prorocentrum cordatum]
VGRFFAVFGLWRPSPGPGFGDCLCASRLACSPRDMWLYVSPHGRKTKLKREVMQIAQEESSGVLKQEGAAAEEAPEARDDDEEAEAPAVEQGGVAAEVEDGAG